MIRKVAVILSTILLTAPIASAQERIIAVELTEAQWNAIAEALTKEPFGKVVGIMSELQRQTRAAIAARDTELDRLRIENRNLKEKNP